MHMEGANGSIIDFHRVWDLIQKKDGVPSNVYAILVQVPGEDSPFCHDLQGLKMYVIDVGKKDALVKHLVVKKSGTVENNASEIINTTIIAANCNNAILYEKTQLQRIKLRNNTAACITYEELFGRLDGNDASYTCTIDGDFYIVAMRAHDMVLPVYKKLIPIDFWHNGKETRIKGLFQDMRFKYERDSLLYYLTNLHSNSMYHNDVKLNNMLVRVTSKGMVTLSLCDYGAMEHSNDPHVFQTTFPCPWLMLMKARDWFDVPEFTTSVQDRESDVKGYVRLREEYLKMHKPYFPGFDWAEIWEMGATSWNLLSREERDDVRVIYMYNDRYGLGTAFLKLKQQEVELGINVDEGLYKDLLLPTFVVV